MADKLTYHVIDALSRAAAEPAGVALVATKAEPGLFPAVPAGKTAAQKAVADGLLKATDARQKLYTLTDAGWAYLLAAANPKQVLEDFVRVLEARQTEVNDLLTAARRMADSLFGLRDAVSRVLPKVTTNRVASETAGAPPTDLADVLLAKLADWAATAGEDCPLPDLYRRCAAPSVGAFHDALRTLHDRGAVYLHPWTGPLYALPEPAFALLVGHGIAYYASIRTDTVSRRADRLAAAV
ncbi:hypothetical protein [Urbifossiella limnaea]|uniref:Uncharacterized protein n=1 Tax=Urbifossiella limnaea TaxID=2528023 RepID=A0A517XU07_9BACT|nr:hypothetical protein [Urbifossiella limnaea]QDU20934.1 hypothetical protein ETAA1_28970 [Urbifossiella limnaea]